MREAKQRAAATGRALTRLVHRAIRTLLARDQGAADFKLDWTVVDGGAQPGVELTGRVALYELMERAG